MRTKLKFLIIGLILTNSLYAQKVIYLDEDYPDLIPQKYAQGIINVKGRYQQNITMSPDGKEQLFTQTDSALWRYERILRVRNMGQNKILVDTPEFVKDFKYEHYWMIGEPMISPDNKDLYFTADYPPDHWNSKRTETGDWSKPIKMDSLSIKKGDWYTSVSRNNTLYFTNGTIYKSLSDSGKHNSRIKVEGPFNHKDARDPCISPNEDYMIFESPGEGGNGQGDLYVCFNDGKGNWSEAYDLGKEINTENFEFGPYISPDEKYLFFSRREKWNHTKYSDIYWVSLKVLDKFREKRKFK
ncbi:MAG: hypothetical protein ABR936_16030 [Bacteroidota bacterium]|jgi:hypothetical protein